MCHDGVVGCDAVGITPAFDGLLEDEIAIGVIGIHDILVAVTGLDGELSSVIHVELADGEDTDVDFVGREA
jgi:hypothetical protein